MTVYTVWLITMSINFNTVFAAQMQPALNRCQSRLEARGIPGSQVNNRINAGCASCGCGSST